MTYASLLLSTIRELGGRVRERGMNGFGATSRGVRFSQVYLRDECNQWQMHLAEEPPARGHYSISPLHGTSSSIQIYVMTT